MSRTCLHNQKVFLHAFNLLLKKFSSLFERVMLCFVVRLISLLWCFISPNKLVEAEAKNSWQVTP